MELHRRLRLPARGVIIAALALLAACHATPKPDLYRLYAAAGKDLQPPVIVIPGVLGSRLRDRVTHEEVWPGSTLNLLLGRQERLALKFDPVTLEVLPDTLEADGLFEAALGQDFYGAILRTLEQSGGYEHGQPGTAVDPRHRRYYVFAYDWRQENSVTARKLDALIEQIRRDYGDPSLRVDLIAHSMGGLVARYFGRYGARDAIDGDSFPLNLDGANKLRTVVLLGTPNLGSVSSLHGFIEGATYGLRAIPPEVLATMPSLYQLFPHPLNDWLVTPKGEVLDRELFDVQTWRDFGWSIFDQEVSARLRARGVDVPAFERYFEKHLERARRFIWALTVTQPESPMKLVVFGGDCTLTPARLVVETVHGESVTRLSPDRIEFREPGVDYAALMFEPGDGSVTKPSLLARQNLNPTAPRDEHIFFPLAYSFFLCEEHGQLTGNINFQDNLLNVLLSGEQPWDEQRVMEKMKQDLK
jgi:pimeloyl-ACP methyl ester carboxylesterase